MIPTMAPRTSRILPLYLLVLGTAVSGLSGCVVDRETTLSRVARAREVQAMRVNRERLANELEVLTQQAGELGHEIAVARVRSVKTAATLRATLAGLNHELSNPQHQTQNNNGNGNYSNQNPTYESSSPQYQTQRQSTNIYAI